MIDQQCLLSCYNNLTCIAAQMNLGWSAEESNLRSCIQQGGQQSWRESPMDQSLCSLPATQVGHSRAEQDCSMVAAVVKAST